MQFYCCWYLVKTTNIWLTLFFFTFGPIFWHFKGPLGHFFLVIFSSSILYIYFSRVFAEIMTKLRKSLFDQSGQPTNQPFIQVSFLEMQRLIFSLILHHVDQFYNNKKLVKLLLSRPSGTFSNEVGQV